MTFNSYPDSLKGVYGLEEQTILPDSQEYQDT